MYNPWTTVWWKPEGVWCEGVNEKQQNRGDICDTVNKKDNVFQKGNRLKEDK